MDESKNCYVSSRGLLKSCDYFSHIPRSSIRQLMNYPNIQTIRNIKNPSIYVCGSAIPHFIDVMLPQINFSFILVSGDCDDTIPNDILDNYNLTNLLNDKRLIHWFSQNMILNHEKITIIPIGFDYHTMTTNTIWGPITSCENQENILKMIIGKSVPFWNRNIKCYANFHFAMETKLGQDRKDALKNNTSELVYYEDKKVTRLITWNKQKDFAFVICPHGGGLDCHRNWEALCIGCIPIVKTSKIDNLYKDLPVLIVNDWREIDINLLNNTIIKFKLKHENGEFNYNKLKLDYWKNLINDYKK